jgi:RHS repeat-associated protein
MPIISLSCDIYGQIHRLSVVGPRTFSYNAALQLTSEAIAGGLYSKTIARAYQDGTGVPGRYAGFAIPADGYSVSHGYDAYGRPGSMTAGTDTFTFAYLANSDLLSAIAYPNDISAKRAYEAHRDLITSIENSVASVPPVVISRYDYTNDAVGRRTSMGKSGTAFSLADLISYGYNDRSEVTSAVAQQQATYDYGFAFDPIGNRLTSTSKETGAPITRSYTANNLNQYTAIDNPTVSPSYDDDGNMTSLPISSGTWDCSWNAENRLIAMEKADKRLEFAYDYMGRRVEKKTYTGSSGNWILATHLRFVYDGYLQIEELDAADSNALLKKRYWTGVEGYDRLISETHVTTGNTYYVMADANKNLTCYLTNAGAVAGHYEYSPFGQITRETGSLSNEFDFRFSSEFFEQETGLVYYNFRYYSPELGRWASRDPIEEVGGGGGLYGIVFNDPINQLDYIGLTKLRNCKDYSYDTKIGQAGGVWLEAGLEASVKKCECCFEPTGEWLKYVEVTANLYGTAGIGVGFRGKILGVGVDLMIEGPHVKLNAISGTYIYNECMGATDPYLIIRNSFEVYPSTTFSGTIGFGSILSFSGRAKAGFLFEQRVKIGVYSTEYSADISVKYDISIRFLSMFRERKLGLDDEVKITPSASISY